MPEEIDPTISEAYDRLAGEDAGVPAVPEAKPETDSAPAADTGEQPAGEAVAQGEEAPFRWENVPAELMPLAKQFQADYTRKAQELAEQRKALETQAQQVQGLVALQQLAQTDPAQAAALLSQYAATLAGGGQAGQQLETDPYATVEPVTEAERLLVDRLRQMEMQQQQFRQFYEQQQQKQAWDALQSEYTKIEQQIGRTIPEEEREKIAAYCVDRKIPSVLDGFRSMYFEQELARARQAALDEASKVVQTKAQALGAPSALVSRTPGGPPEPKNDRDLIERLYDEMIAAG